MRNFSEYLESLIIEKGSQSTVAIEAQIEAAKLSRFRSDQSGLIREEIDRLLAVGGAAIATRREIQQYEDTIEHLSTMWRRERKREEKRR